MRFAIFGAGGLGGYYGARLIEAGHDVGFIARGAHLQAIKRDGLKVLSPLGDAHLESVTVSEDPNEIGAVDVVLVSVKTWQIPQAARAMTPLLQDNTLVIPFLNGVEAPDQLAETLGKQAVLGGLSKIFSFIEAPGVIRHINPGAYLEFGELDGTSSERVTALADTLNTAGIETAVSQDIRLALWRKLLMVSSWAGLGALARSPLGVVRQHTETRALIDRSMDEGIAVARASGHAPPDDFKEELWSFYDSLPADATASMQRDVMAGKPSELDAWNGAIVRFGASAGVATPVHTFTYHTLLVMERAARAAVS